jgi:hypothetical protein
MFTAIRFASGDENHSCVRLRYLVTELAAQRFNKASAIMKNAESIFADMVLNLIAGLTVFLSK